VSAQLLDGAALARTLHGEFGQRVAVLAARGIRPGLAVVQAGDDPASQVYVRHKLRACAALGLRSELRQLAADAAPRALFDAIAALNADPGIHGILVQLPLPPQFDTALVQEAIRVDKDVDGFRLSNLGGLVAGRASFPPCTPAGVMCLLEAAHIPIRGRDAVVVGRSNIVGKPMALLLLGEGATVTICHSQTRALAEHTRRADILVVAAGKPGLIDAAMVRPGAAVIDVGIHRRADGSLAGDVDFASVRAVAGHLTPVPGGVGPMTIAMLLANTLSAAEGSADAPLPSSRESLTHA